MRTLFLTFLMLSIFGATKAAAGEIAIIERQSWLHAIDSQSSFNEASRHEILMFYSVMNSLVINDEAAVNQLLASTRAVNLNSVKQWQAETQQLLLENFRLASARCTSEDRLCLKNAELPDLSRLSQLMLENAALQNWRQQAQAFYLQYIKEQIRLAALFPNPSSEIAVFDQNEINGSDWPDLQFFLTFDDGPHKKDGNTEATIRALNTAGVPAAFFVLGERIKARQNESAALTNLYSGFCVASHGMEHQSHAKWDGAEASMRDSAALLRTQFGDNYRAWFRPPYGQRQASQAQKYFDLTVLWNIDSQDWNAKISAQRVADRVFTLMLLWRRGIILFHDTHTKASTALPAIWQYSANSSVKWLDCKDAGVLMKH